jgi:hypothetical protein
MGSALGPALARVFGLALGTASGIGAASVALIEVITIIAQRKLANHNGNQAEKHPKFVKGVVIIGGTLSSGFAGFSGFCFVCAFINSIVLPTLFGVIAAAAVAYLHLRAVESYLSEPQNQAVG